MADNEKKSKILDWDGFRTMGAWFTERIKALFAAEKADFSQYIEEKNQQYAGAVYLTQSEYDALTDEQKNDTTKVYFIEEQLS